MLTAFGANYYGQCNVPPLPPAVTYVQATAGENFTIARRSDGSALAWGNNSGGVYSPPPLPPGISTRRSKQAVITRSAGAATAASTPGD